MVAAMAGFTIEDLCIKKLSSTIAVGQILIILGIFSSVSFAVIAVTRGHHLFASDIWTRATIIRMCSEAVAAVAFVTSLSLVPISIVAAVFQVTPLTITIGAALFLGEKVRWRRWLAISIGLMGVLLIIKPGFSGFDPSVLWVLFAVLSVALRDLMTRVIPSNVSSTIISFQAYLSLVAAGTVSLFITGESIVLVSKTEFLFFVGGVVFGAAGYYGIVSAMRIGDASVVSPFRYTRLLFSLLVGVFIFNEHLEALTLLGSAIIIATGLYSYLREHRLAQERSL